MKRLHVKRAYSLLELIIAVGLLFIACTHLFNLYAFGAKASRSSKEASLALLLAQEKMEEWSFRSGSLLGKSAEGTGRDLYSALHWKAEIENFSDSFYILKVSAWAPNTPKAVLRRLCAARKYAPISMHKYDSEVCFNVLNSGSSFIYGSYWQSAFENIKSSSLGKKWVTDYLAGHPGSGIVWLCDGYQGKAARCLFNSENKLTSASVFSAPKPKEGFEPVFCGIAADIMGNYLFCADSANRGLWILDDSSGDKAPVWIGSNFYQSSSLPLGDVCGICCDQYGSTIFICEGQERRIRSVFWGSRPQGVSCESFASAGFWGPVLECPYEDGSSFLGAACNSWGSVLYALDKAYLYVILYSDASGSVTAEWKRVKLPADLAAAYPQGIASDPYCSRIYINTSKGPWAAEIKKSGAIVSSDFKNLNYGKN